MKTKRGLLVAAGVIALVVVVGLAGVAAAQNLNLTTWNVVPQRAGVFNVGSSGMPYSSVYANHIVLNGVPLEQTVAGPKVLCGTGTVPVGWNVVYVNPGSKWNMDTSKVSITKVEPTEGLYEKALVSIHKQTDGFVVVTDHLLSQPMSFDWIVVTP